MMARNKKRFSKPNDRRRSESRDYRKGKSADRSAERVVEESETNAQEWYSKNKALLESSAGIVFSQPAGMPFTRIVSPYMTVRQSDADVTPGLMTFRVIPNLSSIDSPAQPVNTAAKNLYATVRQANSGASSYSANDLFVYIMALGQCYAYINFLQRVYGQARVYDPFNRYLPDVLVTAQSVSFTDVTKHKADFAFAINALIERLYSFVAPQELSYFNRLAFLFSGYYSEGETVKDQLYMMVPEGFMIYSDTASTQGTSLQWKQFYGSGSGSYRGIGGLLTVDELYQFGLELIQPILDSTAARNMSGDIMKAYGQNVVKLAEFPLDYTILPVTDLTVLEQLQNCDYLNMASSALHVAVLPNIGHNTITPIIDINYTDNPAVLDQIEVAITQNHVMTTILTNPTYGDVMERTRLMYTVKKTDPEVDALSVLGCTEIVSQVHIFSFSPTDGTINDFTVPRATVLPVSPTQEQMLNALLTHCRLENFKFHPAAHYFTTNADLSITRYQGSAVDIDNIAILSDVNIKNMNEAAMLSMFSLPHVGIFK